MSQIAARISLTASRCSYSLPAMIETNTDELVTVRQCMRSLNVLLEELRDGNLGKLVLINRGDQEPLAVVLSAEHYEALVANA